MPLISIITACYNQGNFLKEAFASIELNLDIMNEDFAMKAEAALQKIIDEDCKLVVKDEFSKKNHLLMQFWQWLCYQAIQVSFFMFTFYFKRRRD